MTASAAAVPELGDSATVAARVTGRDKADQVGESQDPRDAKRYTFPFEYTDARGKVWRGTFTNNVLTVGQYRQVKIIKANLNAALPVSALDASTWELNEMVSHLMVSLDQEAEGFPAWAKKLDDLYDARIIEALYQEVASHEARFHRREPVDPPREGRSDQQSG